MLLSTLIEYCWSYEGIYVMDYSSSFPLTDQITEQISENVIFGLLFTFTSLLT